MIPRPTPNPNYKPKPLTPRKVKGGIKLSGAAGLAADPAAGVVTPSGGVPDLWADKWAAQRWMRLIEQATSGAGDAIREGLGYAIAGQTRRVVFEPGRIVASIQGTQYSPYDTVLTIKPFSHEQIEAVVAAMSEQAVHAAKLLAGELLPAIEDVLAPLGIRLFPIDPSEITPKCSCKQGRGIVDGALDGGMGGGVGVAAMRSGEGGAPVPAVSPAVPVPAAKAPTGPIWCKHCACLALLVAERLASDPFQMFSLRGLAKDDLLERLRQRRAVTGSALGGALIYQPHVQGVSDLAADPLEGRVDDFWEAGPELAMLDTPIEPPAVSHPLLRRLGPSPLGGTGKFPLVGLLATCYSVVSQAAIASEPTSSSEAGDHAPAAE